MRTFASLAMPGTYLGPGGLPLVGRLVANTEFLKALFRYADFERYVFFAGEAADRDAMARLLSEPGWIAPDRAQVRSVLELPRALAAGELSVLHHSTHVDAFPELVWLRDRYATGPVPVTGHIHSLSYPRMMLSYARAVLHPAGETDAIICTSDAGRRAVERCFSDAAAAVAAAAGGAVDAARVTPALHVLPFGVDVDRLTGGAREATRARLGIPANACVVLALGRFTEYDKMDLFPLLQVFRRVRERRLPGAPPVHLLLAGARQGTKTPEMLGLWAKLLGIDGAVTLRVDFPEDEKRDLLAASDLFVSPCDNVQETFGISVVEAMAAGLPVVVSDFDGYRETAVADVGIRVTTRRGPADAELSELAPLLYERPLHLFLGQNVEVDLRELELAIAGLCADEPRRREMGRRAAEHARARYHWRFVIQRVEALWRELATRPSRARPPARHPLAMRFGDAFAHFPTEAIDPARVIRRSTLSRQVAGDSFAYVIYPELKNVFDVPDVLAALDAAEAPVSVAALRAHLSSRWPAFEEWRPSLLVTWMLKHGLLE